MSLFKVRDLWKANCGKDEVHEYSSITIADINGEGYDYIIVGGHNGYLRIFNPQSELDETEQSNFKPTDLIIEVQLSHPILQVAVGRLVSGSKSHHLVVLHPRSIVVYSLITVAGSAEHGDQSQLYLAYEHQLKRSAYNLIVGGFGGVEGRDFICVQGLDGTLMFFEQETLALTRSLPTFLLPSPIAYVPHTDSFVVLNSNWHLESYRYQILGEESSKKLTPSWTYNLGESVLNIHYVWVTTNQAAIVVVAERTLFSFRENGVLQFCKRLMYIPVCSMAYCTGQNTNVISVVVSETNDLMIYDQTTLKWSAQLHMTPVAVTRANLRGSQGTLVLLSEEGDLECCYLGTEPSVFVAPPVQGSITSMSEAEAKLATVQQEIATFMQSNKNPLEPSGVRPDVKLTTKVWPMQPGDSACRIEVCITPMIPVNNLHLVFHLDPPFTATPKVHHLSNLADTTEFYSLVTVEDCNVVAWNLEVLAVCSYLTSDTIPGVSKTTLILPIQLVLELAPPVRDSPIKLTFSVAHIFILPTIFPEFRAEDWSQTGSTETLAGFRYKSKPEMTFTLALSKNYSKYRLETENVTALTLPASVLSRKLSSKKLSTFQHTLAVKELLDEVENNVRIRNIIRQLQTEVKQATSQYRAVQRRILSKLRDKIPSNITPLHKLMNQTHNEIMEAAHNLEQARNELTDSGNSLGNLVKLTMTLYSLSSSTCKEDVDNLTEVLSCTQHYTEEQGWAEMAEIGVMHMLRTSLARSIQDQQRVLNRNHVVTNGGRLRKYIAAALERVAKGHNREDRVSPILEGEEEGAQGKKLSTPPTIVDDDGNSLESSGANDW